MKTVIKWVPGEELTMVVGVNQGEMSKFLAGAGVPTSSPVG